MAGNKILLTKRFLSKPSFCQQLSTGFLDLYQTVAERNPAGSVEEVVSRIDNDYDKDTGKPFWKNVKLVISKLIYQVYHQLRSSVDKPGI